MATSSMCLRSMSNLVRFVRAGVYPKTLNRFCTTASSAKSKDAAKTGESDAKDSVADMEQKIKELTEEIDKLKVNREELQDKYRRSLAEQENVRTRMSKQAEDAKIFGIQGFCKDLLEVADILQQATDSTPKDELDNNPHLKTLFEGLTMTNTQMLKVFSKHGLVQIDPDIGEKFDPFVHEAMFQVPSQEKGTEGTVAVKQKMGYKLHERTLRPAAVGVFHET